MFCRLAGNLATVDVNGANNSLPIDNTWHHVALVADRDGYAQIYTDGVASGNPGDISGIGDINSANSICIGNGAFGSGCTNLTLNGTIDDVRIYNRALSAQEIQQLYNIGR